MKHIIIMIICFSVLGFHSASFAKGKIGSPRTGSFSKTRSLSNNYFTSASPSTKKFIKSLPKSSGTYEFTSANGKSYIGKSNNIQRRIGEHIKTGKLNMIDKKTLQHQLYPISDKPLRGIEKTKIRTFDILTKGSLANKQLAPYSRNAQKGMLTPKSYW